MPLLSRTKWALASIALLGTLGVAAANLVVNLRAERILAANARQAAQDKTAAEQAAAKQFIQQQEADNERMAAATVALDAQNKETERETKQLERDNRQAEQQTKQIQLETWGPDGPPKGVNTKACKAWTARAAAGHISDPPPPDCT